MRCAAHCGDAWRSERVMEGIEVGFRMEDLSKQSGDLLGLDGI